MISYAHNPSHRLSALAPKRRTKPPTTAPYLVGLANGRLANQEEEASAHAGAVGPEEHRAIKMEAFVPRLLEKDLIAR